MTFRQVYHHKYLTSLPVAGVKVRYSTAAELYGLKKGKKKWTIGNIEPRKGLPLLIKSNEKYWYRVLDHDHDMDKYRRYIRDGNLYIVFTEYWQNVITQEREKMGMTYYDYNKIRHLILLSEILDVMKLKGDGYQLKKRALTIEINKITKKYEQTTLPPSTEGL